MIRAVLDTNVWVSAMLTPGNPPAKILEFALTGKMRLIISPGIIREIGQVLKYPKVKKALKKHRITSQEVDDVILKLLKVAIITPGEILAEGVSDDPADDMVIACALEGRADFIISGDHHLTDLTNYQGIKIVAPSTFLALIAELNEE
jgi:putative PIN family toxin of toxin-antitoxin system